MSKKLLYIIIFILTFVTFIFIYLFSPFSDIFDNKLRDQMFLMRGDIPTTNQVVIVDIDEKSLKALGQWPWSRDKIAQILYNLTDSGALIIGLDIFFAEKDTKSLYYLAKKYHLNIKAEDNDIVLAKALETTPTITGFYFDFETNTTKNVLPDVPAIFIERNLQEEYLFNAKGYIGNIPIIQDSAYSGGFINMIPDFDGVVRHVPLLIKYDDIIYPSLAFEMFRIAIGAKKVVVNYSQAGVDSIIVGNYKIKTDRFGRLFINYRGDKKKFKYISAIDVYNGTFNKNDIKDKFVLVGTSAGGLFDLRVTPFNNVYPGVEVHANIIDNLLQGDFLYRPDIGELVDILSLFLMALIITLVFYFSNAVVSYLILILMVIGYFMFVYYLMFDYGYIINILLPITEIVFLAVVLGSINYLYESRTSHILREAFAKKVSHKVMEELIKDRNGAVLAPKNKEITVFFSDIRDFTNISEKLNDPKKVIELLNIYMTPMVENINIHKGTIDKFIGDAIMAYWNAPVDIPNHADEAVSSAIDQINILKSLNRELQDKLGLEIDIGIGINSGIATIGDMGSEGRSDYTIIGDTVNLASRLESLNKVYGSNILISKETFDLLTKDYIIREVDLVQVKGKTEIVQIFEVVGFGKSNFDEYNKALKLYREAKFFEAKSIFQKLYDEFGDKLYKLYLQRCNDCLKNPPDDFDGICKYSHK